MSTQKAGPRGAGGRRGRRRVTKKRKRRRKEEWAEAKREWGERGREGDLNEKVEKWDMLLVGVAVGGEEGGRKRAVATAAVATEGQEG